MQVLRSPRSPRPGTLVTIVQRPTEVGGIHGESKNNNGCEPMSRQIKHQTKQEWKDHADEVNYIRTLLIHQITARQHAESKAETRLLCQALDKIDEYRSRLEHRMSFQGISDEGIWYPSHTDQHGTDISEQIKQGCPCGNDWR